MKNFMQTIGIVIFLSLSQNLLAQTEPNPHASPIEIGPSEADLSYNWNIQLYNSTDSPVTFKLGQNHCQIDAPDSFTIPAKGTWQQTVKQKCWDTGLDNCYGSNHVLIYQHSTDPNTRFGIEQSNSSNNTACLGIKIFVIFAMGQAICPVSTGKITAPHSSTDPKRNYLDIACPEGMPDCVQQSGRTMFWKFRLDQ